MQLKHSEVTYMYWVPRSDTSKANKYTTKREIGIGWQFQARLL